MGKAESFGEGHVHRTFALYPVTFRCCIEYSVQRGSPLAGSIRLQMQGHYGLRQFGLSTELNTEYVRECGLFEAPSDIAALADRLKKEDLLEIAARHNVSVMKSWKKSRIVDEIVGVKATHASVTQAASREFVQVRSGLAGSFSEWRASVSGVRDAALCLACV